MNTVRRREAKVSHIITKISKKIELKFKRKRIAVQAHIFYVDLMDEIISYLNNVPMRFDLYISTDTESKKEIIEQRLQKSKKFKNNHIDVFENRGRDVAPFIIQMSGHIDDYDYVCHIHTKKSKHMDGSQGDQWRKYLFDNLLGSELYVSSILDIFENNPEIGVICPYAFKPLVPFVNWGDNLETTEKLMKKIFQRDVKLPEQPDFPVGNMLWIRTKAVNNLFHSKIQAIDFEIEMGQMDGTLAHSIERSWFYIALANNYSYVHCNYYKRSHLHRFKRNMTIIDDYHTSHDIRFAKMKHKMT